MKNFFLLFLLIPVFSIAQSSVPVGKSKTQIAIDFQEELNAEYANKETSPLTDKDFKHFEGLPFFPIDTQYVVVATLEYTPNDTVFEMETTTERRPKYQRGAIATFSLKGEVYQLNLYRNINLIKKEKYKDYYFLPFADKTSGDQSYGGGRYLDFDIKEGTTEIIINFNLSYNPLCAYNHRYSCPRVPLDNILEVEIFAGVKAPEDH